MAQYASTSGSMRSCAALKSPSRTPTLIGEPSPGHEQLVETPEQERRYRHEREVEVHGALEGHIRPEPVKQPGREGGGPPTHPPSRTRNIEVAEPASATRIKRLKDATGPKAKVTGDARSPSKRNGRVRGEVHS